MNLVITKAVTKRCIIDWSLLIFWRAAKHGHSNAEQHSNTNRSFSKMIGIRIFVSGVGRLRMFLIFHRNIRSNFSSALVHLPAAVFQKTRYDLRTFPIRPQTHDSSSDRDFTLSSHGTVRLRCNHCDKFSFVRPKLSLYQILRKYREDIQTTCKCTKPSV